MQTKIEIKVWPRPASEAVQSCLYVFRPDGVRALDTDHPFEGVKPETREAQLRIAAAFLLEAGWDGLPLPEPEVLTGPVVAESMDVANVVARFYQDVDQTAHDLAAGRPLDTLAEPVAGAPPAHGLVVEDPLS